MVRLGRRPAQERARPIRHRGFLRHDRRGLSRSNSPGA
jgi:hypothetical protein